MTVTSHTYNNITCFTVTGMTGEAWKHECQTQRVKKYNMIYIVFPVIYLFWCNITLLYIFFSLFHLFLGHKYIVVCLYNRKRCDIDIIRCDLLGQRCDMLGHIR